MGHDKMIFASFIRSHTILTLKTSQRYCLFTERHPSVFLLIYFVTALTLGELFDCLAACFS